MRDFLDFAIPAYIAEGKTRLTIGDRLHRRLPPLDRHRRGARGLAARAGLRPGRGLPPGARPDVNLRRWLAPGIGIKRWLLVLFAGLLLLALAFAHFLRQVTHDLAPGGLAGSIIDAADPPVPAARAARARGRRGAAPSWSRIGAYRTVRALIDPFQKAGRGPAAGRAHLPEAVPGPRPADRGDRRRDRPVDPAARPQGAHQQPDRDRDRGRRRRLVGRPADELGIPPVGDIRNCIAALADAEPLMSEVLQYRFPDSPGERRRMGSPVTPLGQPADRRDDRGRGRRLRGRRPAGQPDPRRPRPGPAGVGDAADPPRPLLRRLGRRRPVADHADHAGSTGSG